MLLNYKSSALYGACNKGIYFTFFNFNRSLFMTEQNQPIEDAVFTEIPPETDIDLGIPP